MFFHKRWSKLMRPLKLTAKLNTVDKQKCCTTKHMRNLLCSSQPTVAGVNDLVEE